MRNVNTKKKVNAGTPTTKQPAWYKRLIPNRKTRHKWIKQFLQSVKIELSPGDTLKWIFFILVWVHFFPGSLTTLAVIMKLILPSA